MDSSTLNTDFLIIGSGAAGLQSALQASRHGAKVTLVTKSDLHSSSSYWAQGGIAAVLNAEDTFESHINDTLVAGREFCNEEAVNILVKEGAREVKDLIDRGMVFDSDDNDELDLGLEGGHSNRRVLHANGAVTGKALIEFLTGLVKDQPNITITEHAFVYELLTKDNYCYGASVYLYDEEEFVQVSSPVTVLATGGYSGLYQRSTNPHTSTGDGLWLAYEAGAVLKDLEFIQFHPTAFYAADGSTFLLSEAIRGEGARLYNAEGERFMDAYPQKELAPRDVVSQEIWKQINRQKANYVYLDVSHLNTEEISRHFSVLFGKIKEHGIDIEKEGIPVAPAAHYCIGGVATNLNGQTSVEQLYACGEAAVTGVHGANRLASNSLLECLVFGRRAVENAISADHHPPGACNTRSSFHIDGQKKDDFIIMQQRVSAMLSKYVGISRNKEGLMQALKELKELKQEQYHEMSEYYGLRSYGLLEISALIAEAALQREESRGVHIRSDFPAKDPEGSHLSHTKKGEYTTI